VLKVHPRSQTTLAVVYKANRSTTSF